MKILTCLLIILCSFGVVAAQSESQKVKSAGEIRKVLDDQVAAWNRGDLEGYMQGYWKSEELRFIGSTGVTRGWQGTLDRYRKTYGSREKMGTLTFTELDIEVLSKDTAVVSGGWSLARAADNPKGRFTLVVKKFKEGWRVTYDHSS